MGKSRKADKNDLACVLTIQVIPRSSRSSLFYQAPGILKARLTAPPVEGAANRQLIELLSEALSLPRRNIQIVSGEQSRTKRVKIQGGSEERIRAILDDST